MSQYHKVCRTSEVPVGEGRSFRVADRVVAIFNHHGEFYAIDDGCPHMGASLSTGEYDDYVITCPLHAWRFDVRDGTWCDNPRVKINAYSVRVVDDEIEICLEKPEGEAPNAAPHRREGS